jgi:hypothetical protein
VVLLHVKPIPFACFQRSFLVFSSVRANQAQQHCAPTMSAPNP